MSNFKNIPAGRKPRRQPVPSVRSGSRSQRSRSFRYGSFSAGGQGFRESADFDFSKPAFGSIAIGEGRYFWVAFRRLSDWLNGEEPLDSSTSTSEQRAHEHGRSAVRLYLRNREPLPPMPESWVLAYYQRAILDHALMLKQVERYMALLERDEGTVANGYDELALECGDFDPVDIDAGALDLDATDEDEAKAA